VTPIPAIMSCSNNPSGRHFKCSVRFPSFTVHSPVSITELVGEMLCMVIFPYSNIVKTYPWHVLSSGFLPVIYTWLKSRRHSVHIQTDSGPDLHNKFDSPQPLRGWKILLLWIPAACDLTGTTVSLPNLLAPHPFNLTLSHLVDECRPPLYPRFNFSNDSWRFGLVRRRFQCCIPPSPSLALSVYISLQYMLQIYLPLFQDGYLSSSSSLVWPWLVIAVH
jgi:hypothetical protein